MDTRIGYPNEHFAGDSDSETTSPLYATAVGLVMNSLESKKRAKILSEQEEIEEKQNRILAAEENKNETQISEVEVKDNKSQKQGKRFFDKWAEKFKEFLDNAE